MESKQGISIHSTVSRKLSRALQCFCDQINNCEAELFIVLAQKALCLFQILLDQNLLRDDIRTKYISSSALDFKEICRFDGKIAIIDDIMITGSSIAGVANTLIKMGISAEKIQIIALARNKKYQSMLFADLRTGKQKFHCAIEEEDSVCIELSSQICDILTRFGKPYDSDFWAYQISKMTNVKFSEIMNLNLWSSYDVTSPNATRGSTVWTLFPKEPIKKRLWDLLGVEFDKNIHLKIRLYVFKYPNGTYTLKFLPMALFHEISLEDLEKLHSLLIKAGFSNQKVEWTPRARMRFLQFYIACNLYKAAVSFMTEISIIWPTVDQLRVLFGNTVAKYARDCLDALDDTLYNPINLCAPLCTPNLCGYATKYDVSSFAKLNDFHCYGLNFLLLDPFLWWDAIKEIPSRMAVVEPAKQYIKDFPKIQELRSHLKIGFSLRALQEFITSSEHIFNEEQLVSAFLDRAIDCGYVVPIIYENLKEVPYVCRAYRHGEDLPFSKADLIRILFFLEKLDDELQRLNGKQEEYIASISFHKIIVLFFQIGLKNGNIFNRFLGFENDPFLQERFCVHGVIEAIRENTDFSDNTPPMYRKKMKRKKMNPLQSFSSVSFLTINLFAKMCQNPIKSDMQLYKKVLLEA